MFTVLNCYNFIVMIIYLFIVIPVFQVLHVSSIYTLMRLLKINKASNSNILCRFYCSILIIKYYKFVINEKYIILYNLINYFTSIFFNKSSINFLLLHIIMHAGKNHTADQNKVH